MNAFGAATRVFKRRAVLTPLARFRGKVKVHAIRRHAYIRKLYLAFHSRREEAMPAAAAGGGSSECIDIDIG